MKPLGSIIIPTYQHAQYLPAAIDSALLQTVPCEVIVVDDGSTDETDVVLQRYRQRINALVLGHYGVSRARNIGTRMALGDFVMFLDADDTIAPTKIEQQLAALDCDPSAGWALCDVRINDDRSTERTTASQRYGYAEMVLSGDITPLLAERNVIPVMSPLVRRSLVADLQFVEEPAEDWRFWQKVATRARSRYVPEVLATYNRRHGGRSATAGALKMGNS